MPGSEGSTPDKDLDLFADLVTETIKRGGTIDDIGCGHPLLTLPWDKSGGEWSICERELLVSICFDQAGWVIRKAAGLCRQLTSMTEDSSTKGLTTSTLNRWRKQYGSPFRSSPPPKSAQITRKDLGMAASMRLLEMIDPKSRISRTPSLAQLPRRVTKKLKEVVEAIDEFMADYAELDELKEAADQAARALKDKQKSLGIED